MSFKPGLKQLINGFETSYSTNDHPYFPSSVILCTLALELPFFFPPRAEKPTQTRPPVPSVSCAACKRHGVARVVSPEETLEPER